MGTSGNIAQQRAEHIVGDLPDLTLEFGALLRAGHAAVSLLRNLAAVGGIGSLSAPNST